MNWKELWDSIAISNPDPLKQVGRVSAGGCSLKQPLGAVAGYIADRLALSASDHLLDVCCGNGLLTFQLAQHCRHTTGLDFSPAMISLARKLKSQANITYTVGDVRNLPELPGAPFDKICLNFSFQYFEDYQTGRDVVAGLLTVLKPGGLLFIGEVPDHKKRWDFYRTWRSRVYLLYHSLTGANLMGKFWKEQELDAICRELKVKGTALPQPANLPYAHYRLDYLIEKSL